VEHRSFVDRGRAAAGRRGTSQRCEQRHGAFGAAAFQRLPGRGRNFDHVLDHAADAARLSHDAIHRCALALFLHQLREPRGDHREARGDHDRRDQGFMLADFHTGTSD